jgi:hypothetical protein
VTLAAYLDDAVPPRSTEFENTLDYPTPDEIAGVIFLVLSHGVEHGLKLETMSSGKWSIIGPTFDALLPEMKREWNELFS